MTDDQEIDDQFRALTEGLDAEIPPPTDVVSVCMLDELGLSRRFNEVRQALLNMSEMVDPKTEKGRELHSERAALIIEMRRRGMQ